jgi:hypothetical protein
LIGREQTGTAFQEEDNMYVSNYFPRLQGAYVETPQAPQSAATKRRRRRRRRRRSHRVPSAMQCSLQLQRKIYRPSASL